MSKFEEYMNHPDWKKIISKFTSINKLAVYAISEDGNEIKVFKEIPTLCRAIYSDPKGKDICNKCRSNYLKSITDFSEPLVYTCSFGFLNVMSPLIINNKIVGALVCGGIRTELINPDIIVKETNLNREEVIRLLSKVPKKTDNEMKLIASHFHLLCTTLPDIMYRNIVTDKKVLQMTNLHKITNMINSTLDLNQILKGIMEFLSNYLSAKNCSILIFENNQIKRIVLDTINDSKIHLQIEELLSKEVFKSQSAHVIPSIKKDPRFNTSLTDFSVMSIPIKISNKIVGTINLYGDFTEKLNNEYYQFIAIVSNQAATAIRNAQQYELIRQMAITDKLTGLYNRRYFMESLKKKISECYRGENPISLIMVDIDHFGHYNNTNGHQAGDKLLSLMGQIFLRNIRSSDIAGRYGGEEFIVILPKTDSENATLIANAIMQEVRSTKFDHAKKQPNGKLSISMGVITCLDSTLSPDELIKQGDVSLYDAKHNGRDQIIQKLINTKGEESFNLNNNSNQVSEDLNLYLEKN